MGVATFLRPRIPDPLLIRTRCTDTSSNVTLWMKSEHEGELTSQLPPPEKPAGSKYNSTHGLSRREYSRGKRSSIPQHKTRPDSSVPTLQRPCDRSHKWRGTLSFCVNIRGGAIHPCSDARGIRRCPSQRQRSDFPEETRAVPQVDKQIDRNPKLPARVPPKQRNSPLHA